MNHFIRTLFFCFFIMMLVCCNQTTTPKEIRKKKSLCPQIIIDKNADKLLLKTEGHKETRLFARINTENIICNRNNGMMNLSFNIVIDGDKKEALKESQNAHIPINYYIKLNLTSKNLPYSQENQENNEGIYFITLKETQNNKMIALKNHTIALPIGDYAFVKSAIHIGFISEDKTIILY